MVQVSSYFISLVVILIVQLEFVNSFVSYNKFHFTIDREHVFYSTENTDNPGTPNSGTNSNSISNSNSNSNSPHIRSDIVNFDVNKLKQWRMAEMYPTRVSKQNMEKDSRGYPNYAELPPDDPLFLDMPWPEETGPESSAFARHFQWKRKLSDGESKLLLLLYDYCAIDMWSLVIDSNFKIDLCCQSWHSYPQEVAIVIISCFEFCRNSLAKMGRLSKNYEG